MIAYKGFSKGLRCLGHQFAMGQNVTDEANCAKNGFHSAENPLDCLSYYSNINNSEYYIVDAQGDIDEDGIDSKIACTKLIIIRQLTPEQLFLHGLAYMVDHPLRKWSCHVKKEQSEASNGYAVVRGIDPVACGAKGDILVFAKEDLSGKIIQVSLTSVDGKEILPHIWYDANLMKR